MESLSSKRTTPERCPRPLLPQDCKQEDPDVPQDHQGEDLPHINTTETYVRGDERSKEEIPTDNRPGDCNRRSEGLLTPSDFQSYDLGMPQDTYEEHYVIPAASSMLHSIDLPSDPIKQVLSSDSSPTIKENESHRRDVKATIGKKTFSCSECGKYFNRQSNLIIHKKTHTGEKPYSCPECGKCFAEKSKLVRHQKIHAMEKPFACLDCGKCFNQKYDLVRHQKIHTEMDPNTSNPGPKQKRRSYEADFKLKVVSRAEESNNSTASKEFCVAEKQVREWRKMKADLKNIPKAKKARRGLTTSYGALETELHKWVMECRQNGYCVTRMGIRLRALQMAKDDKLKAPGIENFVASAGWCARFMNRFALFAAKDKDFTEVAKRP
ncbi:uncharacterized protein ACNLHF_021517 [Anomaloglossus baeobatrachus]|uniref:uncharacterized protein LOC142313032 n=1 Tax=Anomaloglossus baeobatrachus TaxID=238106 RepID=UPI003F4F5953